jgi:PAS domain S-box-containing protein
VGFVGAGALAAAIVQTARDLIWAVDCERFGLIAFNQGMAAHFLETRGIRVELGQRPDDLFPPGEFAERWKQLYDRALGEGTFRTDYRTYDGKKVLQLELYPMRRGGVCEAIAVFGRDVSEETRLREAVERSDDRFRRLVEYAPVAYGATRGPAIVYVNRRYRELFGIPPDADLAGRSVAEHVAPEFRAWIVEFAVRRRDGLPAPAEYETVGQRGDGTTFPMHVSAALVDFPDGPATLAVFTDLSARREMERSLGEREAFFRAVLERSPDVAAVISADRRFRFVSSSVQTQLGWTEAETRAMDAIVDIIHPDDRELVAAAFQAIVARDDGMERRVFRMLHRDGTHREMDVIGRNLVHDPDVQGVVVNARDTAELRRIQDQLRESQKLESVGRLAGGVAHDFNNILTVILSCGEALRRQLVAGRVAEPEDVEQINSAAERARDLTRKLLAFARRQVIAPEVLELNRLVEAARKMLSRLAGEDVELVLDLEEGIWPVRLDPAQLDQILLNLVANARDALPQGGRVEIATRNVELDGSVRPWPGVPEGRYVRLMVADDGMGMSPEVRERIFDPFFTTKEIGRGTGLGLATVQGIVSQSGGWLRVDSEPGHGSRFEILFPRTEEKPAPAGAPPPIQATEGTETVLLVEDDPAVRRQALRALAAAGYTVHVAGDGLEALDIAGALGGGLDLLVTDVVMPRLDGPRLADAVRQRWPGLPVLFMSGYTDDRLTARGVPTEGVDLLQKPFTGTTLLQRVRAALDRAN